VLSQQRHPDVHQTTPFVTRRANVRGRTANIARLRRREGSIHQDHDRTMTKL
jgi:hypothetical protein